MVAMVAMVAAQEQVMQAGIRPESIGIISPYGAQVGSCNGHQRTSTDFSPVTMAQVKLIQRSLPYNAQMSVQVSTVDAFQGRMAQNLVRWSQGRDMPLSKVGVTPFYSQDTRKHAGKR